MGMDVGVKKKIFSKAATTMDNTASYDPERERLLGVRNNNNEEDRNGGRCSLVRDWISVGFALITALVVSFRLVSFLNEDNESVGGMHPRYNCNNHYYDGSTNNNDNNYNNCFRQEMLHVRTDQEGFPSYWTYAVSGPMEVTYDGRSFFINSERAMFFSGSLHPARATMETWNNALDQAVRQGLNMITLYVMWAEHQPFSDMEIDWDFPVRSEDCRKRGEKETTARNNSNNKGPEALSTCDWNLASAIRAAANRGLFVHIRIGPYACAEYNYGGIPEWVALESPTMTMRRLNPEWMDAMETFVTEAIDYLTGNYLWAYQGGPIVMAQIENEIGGNPDEIFPPNATMQDYADWCGALVARLAPQVVWTMCHGSSANNTISTCNGLGDCSTTWLESHGGESGRIQIDQPALLTELEGGFQAWGEEPNHPRVYFWGQTARDLAFHVLRWFARGGTHMNYYMWWGGYNRRRQAALGLTNMYANDVFLCSSGERHEPKFSHFRALHEALIAVAPTLLYSPSALLHNKTVEHLNKDGLWEKGSKQKMFLYASDERGGVMEEVVFVENDADATAVVRVPVSSVDDPKVFRMMPYSAVVLVDGFVAFDSSDIDPDFTSFERSTISDPVAFVDISECTEVIGASAEDSMTVIGPKPEELTALNIHSHTYSDYVWYETEFEVAETQNQQWSKNATLLIDTQMGSAFTAYIDDVFVGSALDFTFKDGNCTLAISLDLGPGRHRLSLLSESLGYLNLIGRWGASTKAKTKGLTGNVRIVAAGEHNTMTLSLVDGREWRSFPGLHRNIADPEQQCHDNGQSGTATNDPPQQQQQQQPSWWSAKFVTPNYDPLTESFVVDITSGRGHLWLNGNDLGRFWNITRGNDNSADPYSQRHYFLPYDLLNTGDENRINEMILFDSVGGGNHTATTRLLISKIHSSKNGTFKDEVDYPFACI